MTSLSTMTLPPPTPEQRWRAQLDYARGNVADAREHAHEAALYLRGAAESSVEAAVEFADAGICLVLAGYRRARAVTSRG